MGSAKKELATIKVLGFYDQEVYRYIFREIELLALIGSGVGLALGVPLHKFIVLTVEMDQLMFIRTIAAPQLPAGGGADHGVYRGGLLCHAAARPAHQHGGKHEGSGVKLQSKTIKSTPCGLYGQTAGGAWLFRCAGN